jgi:adenine-specific DNA-methyltransferase
MPDENPDPLPKTTPDVTHEQIEKLKRIFPECVTEDGDGAAIDFERLRATLGEADALADDDAYTFTWAGKEEAFRAIQTPSGASLAPAPQESVNWHETRHLFIEGENLEVLKLLYKSYFGRVKMIYIDPPYNTGNDFIYRDDYSEPRRAYLEKTGQMDAEGNVLTSNPETSGRYHSDWLTMMYPRLFLARQLLREDGVIFVSIDDNEVHHLRLLMNEIFGEENFVSTIVWKNKYGPGAYTRGFANLHEYILCYSKETVDSIESPLSEEEIERYKNRDEKYPVRGGYVTQPLATKSKDDRPNLMYPIEYEGQTIWPDKQWVWSRERMEEALENNEVVIRETDGEFSVRFKQYLRDEQGHMRRRKPLSLLIGPYTQEGTKDIEKLFGARIFDFPKPTALLKQLFSLFINESDEREGIVLDFFAGSGTAAQAVLELNHEHGANRQFIAVQFPEPAPEDSLASEEGYQTIAEIGKERIRRVIAKMQSGGEDGQLALDLRPDEDLGFKVFKLAPSTFREWEPPKGEEAEALEEQLALFDRGVAEDADPTDVIYEVILKLGYSLNAQIEPLDVKSNRVYRVVDEVDQTGETDQTAASFFVCLDDELQDETIDALPLDKETTFVCLDTALDDSQKVNLAMGCLLKVI